MGHRRGEEAGEGEGAQGRITTRAYELAHNMLLMRLLNDPTVTTGTLIVNGKSVYLMDDKDNGNTTLTHLDDDGA